METRAKKFTAAQLALVIAFCAAIAAVFVLLLVLPKHAGELSPLEFRTLAELPFAGKSAQTLSDELVRGELSDNVDSFLEDHFPGRSFFIALNSYYLRLTGRNANQPVIWGREGRLYDAPLPAHSEQFDKNRSKLFEFAEANGLETYIVDIPASALAIADKLPAVHPDYYDGDYVKALAESGFTYVPDLAALYKAQPDPDALYYLTDHHWTMQGAYVCYADLCEKLGAEPVPESAFEREGYEFFGSFYRESGLWLTKPDTLEIWRSPVLDEVTTTIGWGERATVHKGVYDEEKLKEGEVDKYAAYLWSNNALTVIENPNGSGETVMLVKDSYGNSIAPLLAMNYSRIVMLDTRYYMSTMPLPSELIAEYGIEKLIVTFGTESMITDSGLAFLR